MFCIKCGAKLDDGLNYCTQCGNKIVRSSNLSDFAKAGSDVVKSISLNELNAKKCLYGAIISLVFVILFGVMTAHAVNPVKEVTGTVTWVGSQYSDNSSDNIWEQHYYQNIDVVYKNQEWSGSVRLLNYYNSDYSVGDSIPMYIVDGQLTRDKNADVDAVKVIVSFVLLLASLGSCGWFSLQYFKMKKEVV